MVLAPGTIFLSLLVQINPVVIFNLLKLHIFYWIYQILSSIKVH